MADDSVVCKNATDDSSSEEEDENDSQSRLRLFIQENSLKSAFDKTPNKFVPEGVIEDMMTEDIIKGSLEIKQPSRRADEIVEFIMSRAKRTFAIVVWIKPKDVMAVMRSLKKKEVDDNELPIKNKERLGSKGWASDFYEEQWRFVAPIFSTEAPNHDLEESQVLPFVSKNTDSGRGSFGVVSQYVVHRRHLRPMRSGDTSFAVKEIQATEDAQEVAAHWENEARALRTMNQLNQEHIVRFITAFRRRREHCGEEHYLMFEWADGGNLCDLWKRMPTPVLTAQLVKAVVKEILGLAKALEAAHNLNATGSSYRHGDIKPENILIFSNGGAIGTFKFGDWGEARGHAEATEMRPSKTAAKYGTRRYEAPEVVTGVASTTLGNITKRRSRLYDIWAMGCITLELLIWLLYGESEVTKFHNKLGNDSFYETATNSGRNEAKVHHVVTSCMKQMADDPRCGIGTTAIGNLLEIVRTGLLVVKLPQRLGNTMLSLPQRNRTDSALLIPGMEGTNAIPGGLIGEGDAMADAKRPAADVPSISLSPAESELSEAPLQLQTEPKGNARFLSNDFLRRLEEINAEDEDESYWCSQESDLSVSKSSSLLYPASVPPATDHGFIDRTSSKYSKALKPDSHGLAAPSQQRVNYASPELDENDWQYQSGHSFALGLVASLRTTNTLGSTNHEKASRLCSDCVEFQDQILSLGFSITYDIHILEANALANKCDLCSLLWDSVNQHAGATSPTIKFDRDGPFLRIGRSSRPVLSVVRDFMQRSMPTTEVQTGFVTLPDAGSALHCEVFKYWLTYCDQNHKCAPPQRTSDRAKSRLPTRLLDVGVEGDSVIRLWATGTGDTGEWVALSHQWGSKHFSTTLETLQSYTSGIELSSLPATFRDAVRVTRALGQRYLWIDSLCIVQGPGGDFATEAKRMEEVYSGAYCVIAASCAADHDSGFLKPRHRRAHVGLCREGKDQEPFYLCQNIDDFKSHVLDGDLHARGWVLQEHALARRTLFFTEHQTYFECGEGVHCETSTLLNNKLAAFLGDPKFPHILSKASQGERILRYQELYRKYSRLGLSKPYDRPAAIDGLQQRLLRTMRVNGGFGIFDEGVTRGLLRRSLLWRRGADTIRLNRIHFPTESVVSTVPSWSWMAYTGGIDYLQPEFGNFEWENFQSPWSSDSPHNISNTDFSTVNMALIATARQYDLGAAVLSEGELIFDTPNRSSMPKTLCVVLGRAKDSPLPEMKRHYVLVIAATGHGGCAGETVYERVGAGHLPGKCISPTGFRVRIH